jgi:hypothetical protein
VPGTWSSGKCSGTRSPAPGVVGLRSTKRRASKYRRGVLRDVQRSSWRCINRGCGVRKVSFAEVRKEQAGSQREGIRNAGSIQNAMRGDQQFGGDGEAWLGAAVRGIRDRAAGWTSPCKWPNGRQSLEGRMRRHAVKSLQDAAGRAPRAKRARDNTCRCREPLQGPRHESAKRAESPGGR